MKKIFLALGAAALILGATACNGASSKADHTLSDSLNTAFGVFYGQNIKNQEEQIKAQFGDDFNEAALLRGLEAAAKLDTADISYLIGYSMGMQVVMQAYQWNQNGIKSDPQAVIRTAIKSMNDTAVNPQQAYMDFQMISGKVEAAVQARRQEAAKAEADANIAKGDEYVASLKKDDSSIQTSESGLSYKIIEQGDDTRATDDATVKVIYTGRHINGEEFDSSKGEPIEFRVAGVVRGFAEGVQLVGKGGKATLYIPGNLAYGENGQPRAGIAPNEMLVFDIEVVDIIPAAN